MVVSTLGRGADRRDVTWAILLCFFASGMSGLIYQVIWVRDLVLVFGATTFAVSTVLTAFMGGLALGSYYFGRRSERIARPLRLYGILELGIGVYGLAVPFIFAALPNVYQPFWEQLHLSFFAISIVRFLFAAVVLVIPTALMGATLPVLSNYYARDPGRVGLRVGSLYSLNTFGAVLGAAATGFVLMPALGMKGSTLTAASINLVLGLVALRVSRFETPQPEAVSLDTGEVGIEPQRGPLRWLSILVGLRTANAIPIEPSSAAEPQTEAPSISRERGRAKKKTVMTPHRGVVVTVLSAFALSGFVALSYEVIWSRVLALIIGSSVYAFSIMLTTFLIGLALGASAASRLVDRVRRPIMAFALVEIGVGVTSLIGAYLFNDLPYVFVQIYRWLDGSAYYVLLVVRFLVAALVMFGPTFLLGTLFPLVIRIVAGRRQGEPTGRLVGDAYAANTVGAIAGSFASGFILIPWLGLLGSLKVCVVLNFVAAGALFFMMRWRRNEVDESAIEAPKANWASARRGGSVRPKSKAAGRLRPARLRLAPLAGLVVSTLLAIGVMAVDLPWDSEVMSSAVYRYAPTMSKLSRQEFAEQMKGGQGETIFYKEGVTATVVVQKQPGGRVLKVNGKPEASTGGDMPTQILIGSLPLLVRERTDDVLVIGLGSGITLGAVEQFPLKRVTCVELEPAVIQASHSFDDVNNRPLEDPRLRLVSNDGRNYIYTTTEQFDVIISEPSNPWLTGVANLFTLEYFKRGAQRLKPDGVFSQWLQIYEMSPEDVRSLVATFRAAFPFVYLFRGAEGDLMLLGAKREQYLDLSVITARLNDPRVAAAHKRINTTSAADLLSRFYMGPDEISRFCSGSVLNTDDNALIEFSAPRRVGTAEETVERNLKELVALAASPLPYVTGRTPGKLFESDLLVETALGAVRRNDRLRAEQFVQYALAAAETAKGRTMLGELRLARGDEPGATEEWQTALALDPNNLYALINLGKLYLTKQDVSRSTPYLDRAIQVDPSSARGRHLRGLAYQATGDNARAAMEYRKALPDAQYTRSIPTYYLNFGTSLVALGLYNEAAQILEEYVRLAPDDFEGRFQFGAALEILSERSLDEAQTIRAVDELKRALTLNSNHPRSHYFLSKAYRRLGMYDMADREFDLYERFSP